MMYYVSHEYGGNAQNVEKAKKITHDRQVADPDNCYICPLTAFAHLQYGETGYDAKMDLCVHWLSVRGNLIVASIPSEGVRREIEFAKMVNMEVEYL